MAETLAELMAATSAAMLAGAFEEAVRLSERAVAMAPDNAGVWGSLACLYNMTSAFGPALVAAGRALELMPGDGVLLVQRGDALIGLGRSAEALTAFAAAVRIAPALTPARFGLGRALAAEGRGDEALQAFRQAEAAQPGNIALKFSIAETLAALGRPHLAADALSGLYGAHRGATTLGLQIAGVLNEAGDERAALAVFDAIRTADPDCAAAAYGAGCILRVQGQIHEARTALEEAVRLDGQPLYHRVLAGLKTFTPDDPQIAALEALAQGAVQPSVTDQIDVSFALARAYEDIGRPAQAFAALSRGNGLKRACISYDEAGQLAALKGTAAQYPTGAFASPPQGYDSTLPVFIFGMPRSGSSLVEQMLASHPMVHGAGEVTFLRDAVRLICPQSDCSVPGSDMPLPDAVQSHKIGAAYIAMLQKGAPEAARITDKMPGNFLYAGLIARILPQARMIHIRRNAQDCCFSCYATLFARGHSYAYDLGELGRYWRAYETLMAHWRAVLPAGVLLEVAYEDLVTDFEATARQIVDFCGLPWDAHCLDFPSTRRLVRTASAAQVRQPLYHWAVGRSGAFSPWLGVLDEALMVN